MCCTTQRMKINPMIPSKRTSAEILNIIRYAITIVISPDEEVEMEGSYDRE